MSEKRKRSPQKIKQRREYAKAYYQKLFHIDYVDQKAISACFLCPDDECKKTECHDCRYQKAWWDEEYGKEEDDG
jgi:hypothetical protein